MDDPIEECEHGFRKVYYFVRVEERIEEPFAVWDCLDPQSANELMRLNEVVAKNDDESLAEFSRLRKKYSTKGWTNAD